MYCKNCGTELNENTEFCSQCGLKRENITVHKKIYLKNKKGLTVIVILVLAAVLLSAFVNKNSVNSSPEKVAVATIKSEYEIDIDTMMKVFPDFTVREIAVEEGLSENAKRSEIIKKVKESYRYETPKKVKILSTELVCEYDIAEYTIFRELYDYMTDADYEKITKVAKVNVEYIVEGETNSIQITCIEMKNKWYFLKNMLN